MNSGKSTLIAVLTNGAQGRPLLDNGRGSARMSVFQHKHEIESGRTSSISQHITGYDADGRVLNYSGVAALTQAEIASSARKVLCWSLYPENTQPISWIDSDYSTLEMAYMI